MFGLKEIKMQGIIIIYVFLKDTFKVGLLFLYSKIVVSYYELSHMTVIKALSYK